MQIILTVGYNGAVISHRASHYLRSAINEAHLTIENAFNGATRLLSPSSVKLSRKRYLRTTMPSRSVATKNHTEPYVSSLRSSCVPSRLIISRGKVHRLVHYDSTGKAEAIRHGRNATIEDFLHEIFVLRRNFNSGNLFFRNWRKRCWRSVEKLNYSSRINSFYNLSIFTTCSNCIRKYIEYGSSMIYELSIFEMSSRR